MNLDQLRNIYDQEQRIHIEEPGVRREILPHLIRDVSLFGGNSYIIYSDIGAGDADAVIQEQIAYFKQIGHDFEWKLYDHDTPADLKDRLVKHGFEIDEAEAIMVLDMENHPSILTQPVTHDIRQITEPDGIMNDVFAVMQNKVEFGDFSERGRELVETIRSTPDFMSIYVGYVDGVPASAAWIRFPPNNQFASLWGGSTLPQYRRRGLYTALLATRAQEAIRRGRRFLAVDASPMSRPILEKLGFVQVSTSWPCTWHARY